MGKGIKEEARAQELEPVSLSELIQQHVRVAIETAVRERVHKLRNLELKAPKHARLFSLVASRQIKLRRIDGWRKIPAVLSHHTAAA